MKLASSIPNSTHPLSLHPLRRSFTPLHYPRIRPRAAMSSSSLSEREAASPALPQLPINRVVLGCGAVVVDYLATVAAFPEPDDKIRSTSLKVEGGGNVGNALTGAARLGLKPRVISKVANDAQGRTILTELEADGVDTSYVVVAEEGNSPFTYIIVDNETKSRTCIHTPGYPAMVPEELSQSSLYSAIDGASIVYFDVRLHETALVVAEEATRRKIPILIDAEKKREGLDDLLNLATYIVCSEKFPQVVAAWGDGGQGHQLQVLRPQAWTDAPSNPSALVSMLLRLPKLKFVVVTLGEKGCIMLERSTSEASAVEEVDVESLLESLKKKVDGKSILPTCISSNPCLRLAADGIGVVSGRLLLGTAEAVPPSEVVDTTGAGDAFIGATLYALCAGMPPEKMLPFASQVAAAGCRALGARSGLPWRTDQRLAPLWL